VPAKTKSSKPSKRGAVKTAPPTSRRSIYFYRIDSGLLQSGKPKPVDLKASLTQLNGMKCELGGRYVDLGDGNTLCSWIDSVNDQQFRLATIRHSDLPRVEQGGDLTDLQLTAEQGLYEPIHLQLFDDNIIGVEFNIYGPRPSRLSWYLRKALSDDTIQYSLDPLLRKDVLDQLSRLEEVRSLDLAIRPSYASTVREANRDLGAAFSAASRAGRSQIVRLVLSPDGNRKGFLSRSVRAATRKLAARSDIRENAQIFKVRGLDEATHTVEAIDVLKDQLVAYRSIVRLDERSRAISDVAAYEAVGDAYKSLKDELVFAAAAIVGGAP